MDLGIKGRRAIVCASSKGLGRACAISLAEAGVDVTLTARGAEALKKTADDIRKAYPGVKVTEIVGDVERIGHGKIPGAKCHARIDTHDFAERKAAGLTRAGHVG